MAKYKIRWIDEGEYEDEIFDTEEAAEEMALYYQSCASVGAEILHMSNPGDYEYDGATFDSPAFEIVETNE